MAVRPGQTRLRSRMGPLRMPLLNAKSHLCIAIFQNSIVVLAAEWVNCGQNPEQKKMAEWVSSLSRIRSSCEHPSLHIREVAKQTE